MREQASCSCSKWLPNWKVHNCQQDKETTLMLTLLLQKHFLPKMPVTHHWQLSSAKYLHRGYIRATQTHTSSMTQYSNKLGWESAVPPCHHLQPLIYFALFLDIIQMWHLTKWTLEHFIFQIFCNCSTVHRAQKWLWENSYGQFLLFIHRTK